MNKNKRLIIFSLLTLFIVFILIGIFIIKVNLVSPKGSILNYQTIKNDIALLGKDEVTVKHINPFSEKDNVIEVFVQNKKGFSEPLEVKQALRILLYLHERIPPYPISSVVVFINEKWVLDGDYSVELTMEEFSKLYSEINTTSLSDEEVIQLLFDKWIVTNKYIRGERMSP